MSEFSRILQLAVQSLINYETLINYEKPYCGTVLEKKKKAVKKAVKKIKFNKKWLVANFDSILLQYPKLLEYHDIPQMTAAELYTEYLVNKKRSFNLNLTTIINNFYIEQNEPKDYVMFDD